LPQHWNSSEYRKRARKWREKVASLSEGQRERTLCLDLAQGYERLADQVRAICLGGPLRALRRSLIPTALRALIWINFPGASMVINRRPRIYSLIASDSLVTISWKRGGPWGGEPMEPPVSLSPLPHTMRGETDVVAHCQARLSKFGGCFFPCISNIRDGIGNGARRRFPRPHVANVEKVGGPPTATAERRHRPCPIVTLLVSGWRAVLLHFTRQRFILFR
jgi:hypothetical protein